MRFIYPKKLRHIYVHTYQFEEYDRKLCEVTESVIKEINCRRILEVAIGPGRIAKYFVDRAYDVYGIDIADTLIYDCKKLLPQVHVCISDAENLPFKNNSFGAVYCYHSIYFFPNVELAIDEMLRVATPNSYVLFEFINTAAQRETKVVKRKYLPTLSNLTQLFNIIFFHKVPTFKYLFTKIETTITIEKITSYLKTKSNVSFKFLGFSEVMSKIKTVETKDTYINEPRILCIVRKEEKT